MKRLLTALQRGFALLALVLALGFRAEAQTTDKKIVLQGFWWDYWNGNYPGSWANYLTELAPRLRQMDIDAVWIPPVPKSNGVGSVGYSVFDHYDLGDKFQKNSLRTRIGTKDELLRMIAVMHANGIEVIQDMVLNHVDLAGSSNGSGGQDPLAMDDGTTQRYKNFRYAGFGTPAIDESATDYLNRKGRWPKSWPNFYPNEFNACCNNDINSVFWGPDISYESNAWGNSSNAWNPPVGHPDEQKANYMRDQARRWAMWLVKQTDIDGFRWDAVKHFPAYIVQDLSWNAKYNTDQGDWRRFERMFNVGEYVGGKGQLDGWTDAVTFANGGTDFLCGTFDFSLRDGIRQAIYGNGAFDLGSIPSFQQDRRVQFYAAPNLYVHRTVPFVNNHDTFRPQLSGDGNYIGWNFGDQLAPQIDPFEPRLSLGYAIALAVDGSPQIFFEDLFNIGGTGKRFSHRPTDTDDLPARNDLENLMWCHQNLDFKNGAYKVRWQDGDVLIVERSNKALVVTTDSWDTWPERTVATDFAPGTVLKDYSGVHDYTVTVNASQQATVKSAPCNGTASGGRRCYTVWAPVEGPGWPLNYSPPRATTTIQEWDMEDDLGDSHCESLGQGGRLPNNSTAERTAGKIAVQAGTPITANLFPSDASKNLTITFYGKDGFTPLATTSGTGTLTLSHTPAATGWVIVKVRNTSEGYDGQRCWVKTTYTAPQVVDTTDPIWEHTPTTAIWTGMINTPAENCSNWLHFFEPSPTVSALIPDHTNDPVVNDSIHALNVELRPGARLTVETNGVLTVHGDLVAHGQLENKNRLEVRGNLILKAGAALNNTGTITIHGHLENEDPLSLSTGTVVFAGATASEIKGAGALSLRRVEVNQTTATLPVVLAKPLIVSEHLEMVKGRMLSTATNLLTISAGATANAGNAESFVDGPLRKEGDTPFTFPVGNFRNGQMVWAPIGISDLANTNPTDHFTATYFFAPYSNTTTLAPDANMTHVSVIEHWILSRSAGSSHARVTLHWANDARSGIAVPSELRVAHFTGGQWENRGHANLLVSGIAGNVSTSAILTDFSPFTFGSLTPNNPLPVRMTEWSAKNLPNEVRLSWSTISEEGFSHFEIERSAEGRTFYPLGRVPGQAAGSRQLVSYQFADQEPLAGVAYYRLAKVDTDGTRTHSRSLQVERAVQTETVKVFPNPSKGAEVMCEWRALAEKQVTLSIYTPAGQLIHQQTVRLQRGLNQVNLFKVAELKAGLYLLKAEGHDEAIRFVIE